MKTCPFCAEEIQDAAIKCKHCSEFLDPALRPPPLKEKLPFYLRTQFIIISICCVGPLALPLIWLRPGISRTAKIVWSVIIAAVSWYLFKLTMHSIAALKEYYNMANELYQTN